MKQALKNIAQWWAANRWKMLLALWCLALVLVVVLLLCRGGDKHQQLPQGFAEQLQQVTVPAEMANQPIAYTGFLVNYNASMHVPVSVSYVLTRERMQGTVERCDHFEADPAVAGCAQPDDYVLSGYERGHMAPAHDMAWSEASMRESFLMTNVCPQDKRLNEGGWAKLEEKVREWVQRDSVLVVVTGPVLEQGLERIETSQVVIPQRFYKVMIAPYARPVRCAAFVYPNGASGGALNDYAVTINEVERLTGLDFFPALPDDLETEVESRLNLKQWGCR